MSSFPGPIKCADPFLHESNRETCNCDCFADDNSVLTLFDEKSLQSIKNILDEFRILRGLSTNYKKTAIMRIGNIRTRLPDQLQNLGFAYVDKIKLLGFTITNGDNIANLNFEPVIEKVSNIIKFWERFYLSLSGRITVYKTLLLPQINYIATILMPSNYTITNLSRIMENFVCKGFNIAKDRLYRKPQDGGLGMFNLELFITALQCTWIKRTYICCNDNWKFDLLQAIDFNLEYIYRIQEPSDIGSTLTGILSCFRKFYSCFTKMHHNFKKVCIFENDFFGYGRNLQSKFDGEFFGQEIMANQGEKIKQLKWNDIVNDNLLLGMAELNNMGIAIKHEQHACLVQGWENAKRKFGRNALVQKNISEFLQSFKKGSKKFREILTEGEKHGNVKNLQQCKTYRKLIGCDNILETRLNGMHKMWTFHFLSARTKDFLFKFYNNLLGTNQRVNKFNKTICPSCTFCSLECNLPSPLETFTHIFYDCPSVQKVLNAFFDKFFTICTPTCVEYFSGELTDNESKNWAFQLCMDIFRYNIWLFKLEKKKLVLPLILGEISRTFEYIFKLSIKTKLKFSKCTFLKGNEEEGDGE